ncbi:PxKF domain-containing protein [Streptomyces violascens]|uniref:PxKF domain-containing protein n=1 Tax=Streptomyces violascens TaxID=67381 RepID=UPI00368A6B29
MSSGRAPAARRRGGVPRRLTRLALPGTMALALAGAGLVAFAPPASASTTATFSYTGSAQTFTVPAWVTSVSVDAFGAQGQDGPVGGSAGGQGGEAQATLSVTPGQVLQINVGGTVGFGGGGGGGTGYSPSADPSVSGGGGGGASDVRTGSYGLGDRVLVAGGGGGGGNAFNVLVSGAGGSGGGTSGSAGTNGSPAAVGGGAGTSSAGGAGGAPGGSSAAAGANGASATGGAGGSGVSGVNSSGGGGGGGGWYGGGGGGGQTAVGSASGSAGGGGGSGYGPSGTTFNSGVRSGNGTVTLTYADGYTFTGFNSPVSNPPTVNTMKAGRAVPMKFSLSGNFGLSIFASGYPASQGVTCDTGAPTSPVEGTTDAGSSSLSYDSGTDTYNYVWKTDSAWKDTCRVFHIGLNDGSDHTALFSFS